ncbi:MAG: class I SAM-dependent methyltransferase [Acidobacteriia bacterium]|nr:class I SAM-dependent methyltransferase [Terriglobia bacterium]
MPARNVDPAVVESFGREWQKFDQQGLAEPELRRIFEDYFEIFPWDSLPADAVGFDLGCGTGRWARYVAGRVRELHCIDPSAALEVARRNLAEFPNCRFHCASVDDMPLAEGSMDFGYSLGVLHHVPDTQAGIKDCVRKLKPGAPFLLYLYYAFDNRPAWYRAVWRVSNIVRRAVSRSPAPIAEAVAAAIAGIVYWPLARFSRMLERSGRRVDHIPLSAYRDRSFYVMRNDALDRFGTRLEKRFTRDEIERMMRAAGLERIRFSDKVFWCAVGYKQ